MNLFRLSTLCAAVLLATAASAAPLTSTSKAVPSATSPDRIELAREKEAGDDRGNHGKGHRLSDETGTTQIAREKSEGARGHDPHALPTDEVIAREKSEGARGKDPHATQGTGEELVAKAERSHGGHSRPAGKGGA